jgi:hypothetical protein
MNGYLAAGGLLAIGAVVFHGVIGHLAVVQRLSADQMPTTRFGDGRITLIMVRAAWHFVTLTWLVAGVVLLYLAIGTGGGITVPATIGAIFAAMLVGFLVVVPRRELLRYPQWALLAAIAALCFMSTI